MNHPTHIAAPPGELYWRKEVCPERRAKVILRTIGGIAWLGHWGKGDLGEHFTAWCPLPKDGRPAPSIQDGTLRQRLRFAFYLIFKPARTRITEENP